MDNEERSASRKRVDNRVQEFVWAFGSNSEDEIEKQIARQIEQLKKSGDMEKLLHGSWSHMDAFDEDEWLEHLEEHLKENIDIFDFQLDKEDKKQIEQLDLGYSEIIDHQNYMTAKWLNKYKIHD